MTSRVKATRSLNPLHFEDLEPHRFEDLVRQLAYHFKAWLAIEATGRAGKDEGIDIRGFEKVEESINNDEDDKEMIGEKSIKRNVWVIQCKREKELGPAKIRKIIRKELKAREYIYGYVLAAPVFFSKQSYDVFRVELLRRGIIEFHLWGRSELEDMLLMPKNDHLLFAHFGISLLVKRQTKSSEIKFKVNNKNKLFRVLGGGPPSHELSQSVLVRDLYDTKYPWSQEHKDFEKRPRWREFTAYGYHPKGLLIKMHEYFAYFDSRKKRFDYTKQIDLTFRYPDSLDREKQEKEHKRRMMVEHHWDHLRISNQAYLRIDGKIAFEDILLIDEHGDQIFPFPHLYVNFEFDFAPFRFSWARLNWNGKEFDPEHSLKRKRVFPDKFPEITKPSLVKDQEIEIDPETLSHFNNYRVDKFYFFDSLGRYNFLKQRNVIAVAGSFEKKEQSYVEITNTYYAKVGDLRNELAGNSILNQLVHQEGTKMKSTDTLHVLECRRINSWQFEKE